MESILLFAVFSVSITLHQNNSPITFYLLLLISLVVLMVIYINIIILHRKQRFDKISKRTQILDDITSIKGFLIISKKSGVCLWSYLLAKMQGDISLISSFLQALFIFSTQFGNDPNNPNIKNIINDRSIHGSSDKILGESIGSKTNLQIVIDSHAQSDELPNIMAGNRLNAEDFLEFNFNNQNFLVISGQYLRFVIILSQHASVEIRNKVQLFLHRFESDNVQMIQDWAGNIDSIKEPANNLVNELFPLKLTQFFQIASSNTLSEFQKTLLKVDRIHKKFILQLFSVLNSLVHTQSFFKLSTIIERFKDSEQISVKDLLLQMINQKILVEFDPSEKI